MAIDYGKEAAANKGGYFRLGAFSRPVSTKNPEAQSWFDRGLVWSYAFNHDEAVACFEKAIAADSDCAMAYWGIAYALGPNYNKPWDFFDEDERVDVVERTHREAQQALEKSWLLATPVERAIIEALQFRYPADPHRGEGDPEAWNVWNRRYAEAMGEAWRAHPADLDVATLYADALMNVNPWKLWDIRTGAPTPGAHTLEIKAVLERAITQANAAGISHPGLLHLHIHLLEMSSHPEAALPSADALLHPPGVGLIPDAGHLLHMPSHIYVLCGDYPRAIAANTAAIRADERFFAVRRGAHFYSLYRAHNLHFRAYAALFAGQRALALQSADLLDAALPDKLLRVRSVPMADWLEGFRAMRVHVLVRFGCWDDLIALPPPADPVLLCTTAAMRLYARGVAFAATGRVDEAEAERVAFREAARRVPVSRTVFNNTCVDILAVAAAMLDGEIEYRHGNVDAAFGHLRKAIELDDSLPYDEPWGWMQPTRHAYGALLLEQGRVKEAADVYKADLGLDDTLPRALRHPNNVWSLHGYHECLARLGQHSEAASIRPQLDKALALADVPITSSCACRLHCT